MRRAGMLLLAVVFAAAMVAVGTGVAKAAGEVARDEIVPVQINVTTTIGIACDPSVTMSPITTGQKSALGPSNYALCTVTTNNQEGWTMAWSTWSEDLKKTADPVQTIPPEGSTAAPHAWSVAATASGWGGTIWNGTDVYTTRDDGLDWGGGANQNPVSTAGTYASNNWMSVSGIPTYTNILSTTSETENAGDPVYLMFGAEIGASKSQPSGTYLSNVYVRVTAD